MFKSAIIKVGGRLLSQPQNNGMSNIPQQSNQLKESKLDSEKSLDRNSLKQTTDNKADETNMR